MEAEDLNSPGDLCSWVRECGPETSFQAEALAEGFFMSQSMDQHHVEQVRLLHPGFLIPLYSFLTQSDT